MRMWMINPRLLCKKHLLGEHGEIHKHRHNFVKGHNMLGRIYPIVQIQPKDMEKRHNELAEEMLRRHMNHKSPFEQPSLDAYSKDIKDAQVSLEYNLEDLKNRCEECEKLIKKGGLFVRNFPN